MYIYRLAFGIWLAVLLLAAAALVRPVWPQAPTGEDRRAQAERLAKRLDPETRDAVLAAIDSARAERLPTGLLADRALEGASKGARGAAIVRAVRTLAGELRAARAALGAGSSAAELDAAASALHLGVRPEALAHLRAERRKESLMVPIAVLVDLTAAGVRPDSAAAAVLTLARTPAGDGDFVAFRQNVERDIALGAPPDAVAAVRVNAAARDAFTQAASAPGTAGGRPPAPRKP